MARKGVLEVVAELLDSCRSPEEACGSDLELLAAVKERLRRVEQINAELDQPTRSIRLLLPTTLSGPAFPV